MQPVGKSRFGRLGMDRGWGGDVDEIEGSCFDSEQIDVVLVNPHAGKPATSSLASRLCRIGDSADLDAAACREATVFRRMAIFCDEPKAYECTTQRSSHMEPLNRVAMGRSRIVIASRCRKLIWASILGARSLV